MIVCNDTDIIYSNLYTLFAIKDNPVTIFQVETNFMEKFELST